MRARGRPAKRALARTSTSALRMLAPVGARHRGVEVATSRGSLEKHARHIPATRGSGHNTRELWPSTWSHHAWHLPGKRRARLASGPLVFVWRSYRRCALGTRCVRHPLTLTRGNGLLHVAWRPIARGRWRAVRTAGALTARFKELKQEPAGWHWQTAKALSVKSDAAASLTRHATTLRCSQRAPHHQTQASSALWYVGGGVSSGTSCPQSSFQRSHLRGRNHSGWVNQRRRHPARVPTLRAPAVGPAPHEALYLCSQCLLSRLALVELVCQLVTLARERTGGTTATHLPPRLQGAGGRAWWITEPSRAEVRTSS